MAVKISQKCWNCTKYGGWCSWSKNFTPIEGWDAEKVSKPVDSYIIKSCPEFEYDGRCSSCIYYKNDIVNPSDYFFVCKRFYGDDYGDCQNFIFKGCDILDNV